MTRPDSPEYLKKKRFFNQLLTVFGRKPVLEALQDPDTKVYRLHLASSNKKAGILDEIIQLATDKGAEISYHDRQALSRISKNAKQDQGVACDLISEGLQDYRDFLNDHKGQDVKLLALDGVTNPQNLGMIIRSATAGNIDGILLPEKGCAKLDPLVIKASAGTLFKAPILRCEKLKDALKAFQNDGASICGLSSHAKTSLGAYSGSGANVYVLGNETDGVSDSVEKLCDQWLNIPMQNGVESLNVAVTASLIAFKGVI